MKQRFLLFAFLIFISLLLTSCQGLVQSELKHLPKDLDSFNHICSFLLSFYIVVVLGSILLSFFLSRGFYVAFIIMFFYVYFTNDYNFFKLIFVTGLPSLIPLLFSYLKRLYKVQTIDSKEKAHETIKKLIDATPKEAIENKLKFDINNTEIAESRTTEATSIIQSIGEIKDGLDIHETLKIGVPREIDKNISEAKKQQMIGTTNTYADFLERELGKKPTFDDMVKDLIERSTFKRVHEAFNVYKLGWELSGRDISNAQQVYDKYFSS
ncbi:MAG: hypothetical protein ACI7YS_09230 [Flavobacterium sp.]